MANEHNKNYKFLEKYDFKCQQCSNCCRKEPGIVLLTKEDVEKMYTHLEMTLEEFIVKCCRRVYRDGKIFIGLKEKVNYDCIFWNNGCIAYEARPLQCRTFPYWPGVVESRKSWNAEKKRCPGLDKKGDMSLQQRSNFYSQEKKAEYMEMPEGIEGVE